MRDPVSEGGWKKSRASLMLENTPGLLKNRRLIYWYVRNVASVQREFLKTSRHV